MPHMPPPHQSRLIDGVAACPLIAECRLFADNMKCIINRSIFNAVCTLRFAISYCVTDCRKSYVATKLPRELRIAEKICYYRSVLTVKQNKNAQLSLTNPRDTKPCQKLLQFEVETSSRQLNNMFDGNPMFCN